MSNTVKNSLQTKPRKGLLDDAEQAIYPNNPRKPGEYEIRSESDVIGKALLEERDRQGREAGKRITGYSLRKKLLPGIPGQCQGSLWSHQLPLLLSQRNHVRQRRRGRVRPSSPL